MKKKLVVLSLVLVLTFALASTAFAHSAPPCNDTDGGGPSGREYAAHHIVPLAQAGMLGNEGHKPGSHHGFSLCDPSNR